MFKKLKTRWKVNGINLLFILITFALGGSLCGYAGRMILLITNIEKGLPWVLLYIFLMIVLWPVCVLLISIPLGQFSFFKIYTGKVWKKITGEKESKKINKDLIRVAIFASGAGTNAEKIITSSYGSIKIGDKIAANEINYSVSLVVCNKPGAGVLKIAEKADVPTLFIEKERFYNGDHYLTELKKHQIDFIVLAGFLWKIPDPLIHAYPKKIINIHPALLPKFGGTGMYGNKVHESVIAAGEKESGITIHYVDELYDHGTIIFQAKCTVEENETAETLAQKIHVLEHAYYPRVITELCKSKIAVKTVFPQMRY